MQPSIIETFKVFKAASSLHVLFEVMLSLYPDPKVSAVFVCSVLVGKFAKHGSFYGHAQICVYLPCASAQTRENNKDGGRDRKSS